MLLAIGMFHSSPSTSDFLSTIHHWINCLKKLPDKFRFGQCGLTQLVLEIYKKWNTHLIFLTVLQYIIIHPINATIDFWINWLKKLQDKFRSGNSYPRMLKVQNYKYSTSMVWFQYGTAAWYNTIRCALEKMRKIIIRFLAYIAFQCTGSISSWHWSWLVWSRYCMELFSKWFCIMYGISDASFWAASEEEENPKKNT